MVLQPCGQITQSINSSSAPTLNLMQLSSWFLMHHRIPSGNPWNHLLYYTIIWRWNGGSHWMDLWRDSAHFGRMRILRESFRIGHEWMTINQSAVEIKWWSYSNSQWIRFNLLVTCWPLWFVSLSFPLSRRIFKFPAGILSPTWNIVIRALNAADIHHQSGENHSLIALILRLNQAEMLYPLTSRNYKLIAGAKHSDSSVVPAQYFRLHFHLEPINSMAAMRRRRRQHHLAAGSGTASPATAPAGVSRLH